MPAVLGCGIPVVVVDAIDLQLGTGEGIGQPACEFAIFLAQVQLQAVGPAIAKQ